MRDRGLLAMLPLAVAIGIAGCSSPVDPGTSVSPGSPLIVSGSPNLTATVTMFTVDSGLTPEGYRSQYDAWVAIAPSPTANAGVVVAGSTPVFLSTHGILSRVTAASIMVGDAIQVWHGATVVYGAVQAPPGAPAYDGTQIVILR